MTDNLIKAYNVRGTLFSITYTPSYTEFISIGFIFIAELSNNTDNDNNDVGRSVPIYTQTMSHKPFIHFILLTDRHEQLDIRSHQSHLLAMKFHSRMRIKQLGLRRGVVEVIFL
jgi:hypothetical protein